MENIPNNCVHISSNVCLCAEKCLVLCSQKGNYNLKNIQTMKKTFLFAATMLLAVSCVQVVVPAEKGAEAEEATAEAVEAVEEVAEVPKVYSNAYDGYLNVRAEPSTKAQILGRLNNGPEGAELLGVDGKWTKVRVNGVEGYVWSADVQSTPTDAVCIDAKHVVGIFYWMDNVGTEWSCKVNSNGKYQFTYCEDTCEAYGESGKWYLSGTSVVFKPNSGQPRTLKVDVQNKSLIDGNKVYNRCD